MQVLLIKNVPKVGQAGSVVNVADGYARNYLLPKSLAKPATNAAVSEVITSRQKKKRDQDKRVTEANKIAISLKSGEYSVKKEANEQGTLFAALSVDDVIQLVSSNKYQVLPSQVVMDKHIKEIGAHQVGIRMETGETVLLTINILKK